MTNSLTILKVSIHHVFVCQFKRGSKWSHPTSTLVLKLKINFIVDGFSDWSIDHFCTQHKDNFHLLYLKEALSQPWSASISQHDSIVSEGDCVSTSMNRNWLWQIVSHDTIYTIKIDDVSALFISSQQLYYHIMYLTL